MAFKMAGYSYPGKSPKPQKDDDSLNVHASITDMEKNNPEKLRKLREEAQSRVLSGANKQLASPNKQTPGKDVLEAFKNIPKNIKEGPIHHLQQIFNKKKKSSKKN